MNTLTGYVQLSSLKKGYFGADIPRTQGDSQLCATVFPLLHRFGVELDAVWVARVTKTYLGKFKASLGMLSGALGLPTVAPPKCR